MKSKLPRYLYGSWLLSLTLLLAMAPTISAQSNPRSIKTYSTTVSSQSHQFPAAYYNASWAIAGEHIEGVSNATVRSVDPSVFNIPNTSTSSAPESTQATVVYDNGSHINQPGTPDLSLLESVALGMSTLGANISNSSDYGVADDFELMAETEITSISVYAYQTGATSTTINAMYVKIWDGDPSDATSSVIWGDNTTNVFGSAVDSGVYRVSETSLTDRTRLLQKVNADVTGLTLNAGTYWLEYSLAGTASSGPWQAPIVILGNDTTGDALQSTPDGWQPWIDTGSLTPQGLPFQIEGIEAGGTGSNPCSQGTASNDIENGWGNVSLLVFANDFVVAEDDTFSLDEMKVNFLLNPGFDIVSADIFFYEDTGGNGPGAEISGTSSLGSVPDSQDIIGVHPGGFNLIEGIWTLDTPISFEGSSSGETVYWMGLQIEYTGTQAFIETSSIYSTPNESYFSDDGGATWTSGLVNFGDDMHGVITFSGQCESSGGGGGSTYACEQDFEASLEDGSGDLRTLLFADDFEIEDGTTMSVEKVNYRTFNNIGEATTIAIYEDNGGTPGDLVESFSNVAPNSQTVIGENYGFTAYDIEFSLPSAVELDSGIYWLAIQVTEGTDGGTNYWVITDDGVHAAGHYTSDGGVTWVENTSFYDFSFKVEGECSGDGGGGGIVYCIPEGTNSSRFIDNFSTTGGNTNISNMASGFSPDGYGDFYDTHSIAQVQGETVEFSVDIEGGTAGFRVWVDWNQDGVFDITEEVAYASSGYASSQTGTITVPADALEGDTRMRIVSHWLSTTGDVDPCATGFTYGEFEDYKFTVETEGGGGHVYCIPEGTNSGRFIDNFSTTGGNTNISNMDSGFSADGYGDFYDTHTVVKEQGETVQFSVDIEGGISGFRVWVDWNQDGEFDITEEVAYASTDYANNQTGTITVPADALLGDTRMRIVSHWLSTTGDVDPCATGFVYGEFEDYKFTVEEGLGIDDLSSTTFSYYPNPTSGIVNITANKDISSLAIFNILGQQVLEKNRLDGGQVDVSALSTGTYLFRVIFEDGSMETFKVLRQ